VEETLNEVRPRLISFSENVILGGHISHK
jgi:hypothetical protein